MDSPSTTPAFDPAIAAKVCAAVRHGVRLTDIGDRPGLPGWETVSAWMDDNPDFDAAIDRARNIHCRYMEDEILTLADSLTGDSTLADRSRVRQAIAYRKWLMCVRNPSRYGRLPTARLSYGPAAPATPFQEAFDSRLWTLAARSREPCAPVSPVRPPASDRAQAPCADSERPQPETQPRAGSAPTAPDYPPLPATETGSASKDFAERPRLSRRHRRAMASMARKAPAARATSPPPPA
jgi:hypothetical protein